MRRTTLLARRLLSAGLLLLIASGLSTAADRPDRISPRAEGLAAIRDRPVEWKAALLDEYFEDDPRVDPRAVIAGAALDRLAWEDSDPAWPGDRRGSLTALYDSSLPAGWFGFALPRLLDETDNFTAATSFILDPEEFEADPQGFFEISWGLWNTKTTGLDRTGSLTSFAGDTFELLEFDYFPNVSPFFGGPFLSPTAFGIADTAVDPPDSYANAAFAFNLEVALPLGVPLLAVLEHQADLGVVVASVHRIIRRGRTVPVPGAVTLIDLTALGPRRYELNAAGFTLWNDGFGGATPAVRARVEYHSLIVRRGLPCDASTMLGSHSEGR